MSTEFGLYHQSSKTFIWLGKVVKGGYQTSDSAIVAFMANQQAGEFRVLPDSGGLPNEEEAGWQESGDWPWADDDDDEERNLSDELVAFYPPLDNPNRPAHYDGDITDVRVYAWALTPDVIHQMYLNPIEVQ